MERRRRLVMEAFAGTMHRDIELDGICPERGGITTEELVIVCKDHEL